MTASDILDLRYQYRSFFSDFFLQKIEGITYVKGNIVWKVKEMIICIEGGR
jgi:hypothetical protein